MFKKSQLAAALSLAMLLTPVSYSADAPASSAVASESGKTMSAAEFEASLKFQQGKITLPGGIATLNLPPSFRYLGPDDAERVLVDAWGNPPGAKSLGMLFPADVSPLSANGWGVIITYSEDGHIKDNDADSIKYDELLKDMQESTVAANEERKKLGYDAMTLVGWAESPSYDKTTHKFYWAKELAVEKTAQHSLNYNIRVLGRKGVLVLNAVAGMDQIGQVRQEMQNVVAFTEFTKGNSYNDFDSSTDKVAEYGLAALVAGGVAAKLGFFGKIFALLLAAKKLLFVGIVAIGGAVAKFFGRKKNDTDSNQA
ncbi:DUF2167 domain-containing protein [Undibacterium terreum]|uniref:Membrane-anchored protein n=1 Tax=Undibacterium terreum TaxID=1224302 RepID=A0A916U3B2_9BURK|nr:DUF2167 domain-containing protein [Undibacterium terreum]GGC59076.1 hypothetical protein GCM10011396_02460 [Undibacterium terreum]